MSCRGKGCDSKRKTIYKDNRYSSKKSCDYNSDCSDSVSL